MGFRAWMYDIAREQSPSEPLLHTLCERSLAAGYNAIGLYLEHRFAYPAAPWAAAPGAVTPQVIRRLQDRFGQRSGQARGAQSAQARHPQSAHTPGLRIIPFLNTLGHMEGFIRAEGGQQLAEGPAPGRLSLQICPSRDECRQFARNLVADALAAFDDEWIHIGGDETWQLGQCPQCSERVAAAEREAGTATAVIERAGAPAPAGKAALYANYYAELCQWVLDRGRRPCLWADMLLEHPEALDAIPKQTILFDWQYFKRPGETTGRLRERGFDVVRCPSWQTYNSGWCFLAASQANIDQHTADAAALGALGVCVTTWELTKFTNYETIWPLIFAAGRRLSRGDDWRAAIVAEGGEAYAAAADILGNEIPAASEFIKPGTWRTLRDRFVMRQNPFALWQDWRSEVCAIAGGGRGVPGDARGSAGASPSRDPVGAAGASPSRGPVGAAAGAADDAAGDAILAACDRADALLPLEHPLRLASQLHRVAVKWVRLVEQAYQEYRASRFAAAAHVLAGSRPLFDSLRGWLKQAAAAGGSRADLARLDFLIEHVDRVRSRLAALAGEQAESRAGNEPTATDRPAAASYRPAFETLTNPAYVPGDQAAWRTGGIV